MQRQIVERTAAFRLLRTLQGRGFTIQDEARGLWRLGARWSALGRAASEQGALAATAMPILAALGKATGENVYLRTRDGMVEVRDSKDPAGPVLAFTAEQWAGFLRGISGGQLRSRPGDRRLTGITG